MKLFAAGAIAALVSGLEQDFNFNTAFNYKLPQGGNLSQCEALPCPKSDFPAEDAYHAECHINATFDVDCATLYPVLEPMMMDPDFEKDLIYPSEYAQVGAAENDWLWMWRSWTKIWYGSPYDNDYQHFPFDIMFDLTQVEGAN